MSLCFHDDFSTITEFKLNVKLESILTTQNPCHWMCYSFQSTGGHEKVSFGLFKNVELSARARLFSHTENLDKFLSWKSCTFFISFSILKVFCQLFFTQSSMTNEPLWIWWLIFPLKLDTEKRNRDCLISYKKFSS